MCACSGAVDGSGDPGEGVSSPQIHSAFSDAKPKSVSSSGPNKSDQKSSSPEELDDDVSPGDKTSGKTGGRVITSRIADSCSGERSTILASPDIVGADESPVSCDE